MLPYVGYDDYAAAVGTLAPDILVAPLDSSRTSMSKCPNKYLEYSIAGAAGVYSDTPPYSQTIVDGQTGLLVGDDDEASWSAAIARLVEDAPLRQSIAAAARRDVLERFETGVVAPAFARALLALIRESGRQIAPQDPGARGMLTVALFSHSPLPVRRRTDAAEPGAPAGADRDGPARAAGARRRRVDLRGAPPRTGLPDRSAAAVVPASARRHERLPPRRDRVQRGAAEGPRRSQQRRRAGQHDDQRARHAGGRGPGHPQPALGPRRDRLAAAARQRSSEFAAPHDELLLHSATRVIALSNYTSDFCAAVMQRTRLDVIHNWTPVDPQFAAPPDKYRSRRFACLNTFDPHKGYATLLKAAALLKAKQISFELHLYGDGEVRGEMERRAAALGLQDCVRFQGRTTNVQEVYDGSLGVVNPAQVEPFGMTLIEAMARKTPVVATRSGGPADIVVDGQSGYLVDRGDAAAMADRMQALLESPELAQRLGEEGFQRVCAHFNEEAARAAFLPLIEGAVRDFHGYDPAVKTLAKIYRLWLDQAVARRPVASSHGFALGGKFPAEGGPAWPGEACAAPRPWENASWRCSESAMRRAPAATVPRRSQNVLSGPTGAKAAVDPSRQAAKIPPPAAEDPLSPRSRPRQLGRTRRAGLPQSRAGGRPIAALRAVGLRAVAARGRQPPGRHGRKRLARLPLLAHRQCGRHALRRGNCC